MFPNQLSLSHLQEYLSADLWRVTPELLLVATMVLGLVLRMVRPINLLPLAAIVAAVGLAIVVWQWNDLQTSERSEDLFTGLLKFDAQSLYLRGMVFASLLLCLVVSMLTRLADADDAADFQTLLLGAHLGLLVLCSANHLLMIFIAMEMASVPGYVLAGYFKGDRRASEAALKYALYGAAASATMLYGISLLAGRFGSGSLAVVQHGIAEQLLDGTGYDPVFLAGFTLLLVGVGYKLAAVPMHVWLPDVFTGAAAEVGLMLAIASKAAALGLAVRLLRTVANAAPQGDTTFADHFGIALAIVAMLTMSLGNLAALNQTNLRRLLGYSTIAHAGYMLAALAVLGPRGVAGLWFYLVGYFFANGAAFTVAALLRSRNVVDDLTSLRGLLVRAPILAIALIIAALSLLGVPPLAGFAGKFQLFSAIVDHAQTHGRWCYLLLGVSLLNTVISAGYYLKLLKLIALDTPDPDAPTLPTPWLATSLLIVLTAGTIVVGIVWNPIVELAKLAAG